MEIQIKKITIEHAPHAQRLAKQLGYSLLLTQIENNIREVANEKDHAAFVALFEEKIVGWIHAFRTVFIESRPFIEIAGLVVDENYRSKGVGKKLVEKIKEWSLEKAVSEVRVRSNIIRAEAHQFYLALGFTEIKEQKVFQMNL